MRVLHELFVNEALSAAKTVWFDYDSPSSMMSLGVRAFAFLSNKATVVRLAGSMDGVNEHAVLLNDQALTANTLLLHNITGANLLYRHYKVVLTPADAPDTVKAWRIGEELTSF